MKKLFSKIVIAAAIVLAGLFISRTNASADEIDWKPAIDPQYYIDRYADLKAAFGTDLEAAKNHFFNNGLAEGRMGSPEFSVMSYRNEYLDLRNAFGDDLYRYAQHYCVFGKKEGRHGTGCEDIVGEEYSAPSASVEVLSVDNSTGVFQVRVSNIVPASGVSEVIFPTWTEEGGQDDLMWVSGVSQPDGSYIMTYSIASNAYRSGVYTSHAYIKDKSGQLNFVGAVTLSIEAPQQGIFTQLVGDGIVRVTVTGVSAPAVDVYAWTKEYDQDDIQWYPATADGNGIFHADIDWHKHGRAGDDFTAHVYTESNEFINSIDFSVPYSKSVSTSVIKDMSSATNYLIAVSKEMNEISVYKGSAGNWNLVRLMGCTTGANGATPSGTYTIGAKGYAFSGPKEKAVPEYTCYWYSGYIGTSYLFHSILYYPHSDRILDNSMGVSVSHGCIRLMIDDAKWVYDTVPSGTKVYIY